MASVSPSSSPRWDTRNSGFISPSQLQLLKQQEELAQRQHQQQIQQYHHHDEFPEQHELPTSAAAQAEAPQPGMFRTTSRQDAALAPAAPTHSRTTSAFSLFKSKASHSATPSTSSAPQAISEQGELRNGHGHQHTPSLNGKGPMSPATPLSPNREQPAPPGPANGPGTPTRASTSSAAAAAAPPLPPLHPEIRSIVQLTLAHSRKVYFSGPLIRRIERQPDGQRPTKDEGWRDVFAQLGGTTLSLWDMQEIEEASKQGRQVPPSYVNITDAFVEVLGSVTIPATPTTPAKKYTNVLTLNTAGSNLLLFACPSTQALLSWTAAVRLAAWEKSRLEEIYSAHLIRITLNDGRDTPTPLHHGRLEGWVRIRVAGQTDWKRLWMVVAAGEHASEPGSANSQGPRSGSPTVLKKKRISSLFSRDQSPPRAPAPVHPTLQLFASNKPKDKKKAVLTVRDVTQAFAVYPERPELISRSTLMKVECTIGDEEIAAGMRNREGWLLIMPELEGNNTLASEMLKWLIAIHDAFELYGRPRMYSWDPRDPRSPMFAYPIGPNKDLLFLDRELAENLDPRDERTSATRAQLQHILWDRMRGSPEQSQSPVKAPTLPPLPEVTLPDERTESKHADQAPVRRTSDSQPLQLPPLNFDSTRTEHDLPELPPQLPRTLTPITERSDPRNSRSGSGEGGGAAAPSFAQQASTAPEKMAPLRAPDETDKSPPSFFGEAISTSPITNSPPPLHTAPQTDFRSGRKSEDSFGLGSSSRPDSKLSHFPTRQPNSPASPHQAFASDSSYGGSSERDRQSPGPTSQRAFTITPPPPMQAAAKPSSRPASPRPSSSPSAHPHFDSPGRPTSPFSVLTSPHSVAEPQSPVATRRHSRLSLMQDPQPSPGTSEQPSRPTLPSSPAMHVPHQPTSKLAQPPTTQSPSPPAQTLPSISQEKSAPPEPPSKDEPSQDLLREAGALYYMRLQQGESIGPRRQPPLPAADDDDNDATTDESGSAYSPTPAGTTRTSQSWGTVSPRLTSPAATSPSLGPSYFPPQPTASGFSRSSSGHGSGMPAGGRPLPSPDPGVSPRSSRRPSGARAVPVSKTSAAAAQREPHSTPQQQQRPPHPPDVDEEDEARMSDDEQNSEERGPRLLPPRLAKAEAERAHDDGHDTADALVALSYLTFEEPQAAPQPPPQKQAQSPPPPPPVPHLVEPRSTSPTPSAKGSLRSSFAPSKKAEERKARSQAQQAAHQEAVHKPGRRANGKQKRRDANAFGASSDEEEEEEEEEDDEDADSDSDAEPPRKEPPRMEQRGFPQRSPAGGHRELPQVPAGPGMGPGMGQGMGQGYHPMGHGPSPLGSEDNLAPQQRRFVSDQYSQVGRTSYYPESQRRGPSPQPQARGQSELFPNTSRQNVWTQVLERDPGLAAEPTRDTFVQIEPPSQTMTKAFAPHGLLSAGLQDKQDRSAKRQEELARESGASLINVPHKPPPPQTGLLGAVTAHERERKREGGLGATLTERERERRLAEERQRKLDEFQRMQLDQMQQTGSMYGGMGMPPQFTGFNPMMAAANPMMMGMNPMMTGGWGYPGMMNPQHMFAAQQAAQAYQQAMATFSTAGSQVGGEGGMPPMNPMMTGGMPFDPRMSMMGMPMMSPSMTGMGGMNPGMGMGGGMSPMGMGQMGMGMGGMGMGMNMNPQMTGGSAFDANYSPSNNAGGLRAPSEAGGSRPYSQNSSANGQGSPAVGPRPLDAGEDPAKKSSAEVR